MSCKMPVNEPSSGVSSEERRCIAPPGSPTNSRHRGQITTTRAYLIALWSTLSDGRATLYFPCGPRTHTNRFLYHLWQIMPIMERNLYKCSLVITEPQWSARENGITRVAPFCCRVIKTIWSVTVSLTVANTTYGTLWSHSLWYDLDLFWDRNYSWEVPKSLPQALYLWLLVVSRFASR